jgi:hypothetical protein
MVPPYRCLGSPSCSPVWGGVWLHRSRRCAGGDTMRLLKRAPNEVALSALPWALLTMSGQRAWATQVGLAMSLGLVTPSLSWP